LPLKYNMDFRLKYAFYILGSLMLLRLIINTCKVLQVGKRVILIQIQIDQQTGKSRRFLKLRIEYENNAKIYLWGCVGCVWGVFVLGCV
jgi:hypothetical protein